MRVGTVRLGVLKSMLGPMYEQRSLCKHTIPWEAWLHWPGVPSDSPLVSLSPLDPASFTLGAVFIPYSCMYVSVGMQE